MWTVDHKVTLHQKGGLECNHDQQEGMEEYL